MSLVLAKNIIKLLDKGDHEMIILVFLSEEDLKCQGKSAITPSPDNKEICLTASSGKRSSEWGTLGALTPGPSEGNVQGAGGAWDGVREIRNDKNLRQDYRIDLISKKRN